MIRNQIWKYWGGFIVHCSKLADASRLAGWSGCRVHSEYHFPDGHMERDVFVPPILKDRAMEAMGLTQVVR